MIIAGPGGPARKGPIEMANQLMNVGQVFRRLVTASGYRHAFMQCGLDKDLDDLANESRPGSLCDILQDLEEVWVEGIKDDCGAEWGRLAMLAWTETRQSMQQLALHVDFSAIVEHPDQIPALIQIPMLPAINQPFPGAELAHVVQKPFCRLAAPCWGNRGSGASGRGRAPRQLPGG